MSDPSLPGSADFKAIYQKAVEYSDATKLASDESLECAKKAHLTSERCDAAATKAAILGSHEPTNVAYIRAQTNANTTAAFANAATLRAFMTVDSATETHRHAVEITLAALTIWKTGNSPGSA